MKNALMAVLAVAVAALIFVTLRQRSELADLRAAHDAAPAVEVASTKKPARPSERITQPRPEVPPAPKIVVPPPAPAAEARTRPADRPNAANFMAGLGSMMTNPAMKEMIRSQTKMSLEMRYARLFKFFNLAPDRVEELRGLLMDRQMALMDSGLSFLGGKLSPEEQKQKAKDLQTVKESYDSKLKELLGTDDYDALQQYEATEPERMQVDMLKSSLASSGEPLSEQQEYDLVNAMHQARTNSASALMKQSPDTPPDPAQFTQAGMSRALKDLGQMQEAYAAAAQKILTPAQFVDYQKHAEQQKQMNEMGMKFAAQMFGAANSNASTSVSVSVVPEP